MTPAQLVETYRSGHQEQAWLEDTAAEGLEDAPWLLPLSPDRFHKADISGGSAYGFMLPCPDIDGPFHWWAAGSGAFQQATPFVEYLRGAFRWGGFPGLEHDEAARAEVPLPDLTRGLERF